MSTRSTVVGNDRDFYQKCYLFPSRYILRTMICGNDYIVVKRIIKEKRNQSSVCLGNSKNVTLLFTRHCTTFKSVRQMSLIFLRDNMGANDCSFIPKSSAENLYIKSHTIWWFISRWLINCTSIIMRTIFFFIQFTRFYEKLNVFLATIFIRV